MKKVVKSVLVMAMVLAFAGAAYAGSTTATMQVFATAQNAVGITVLSDLNFGTFDNTIPGDVQANAQIQVTAQNGLNYDITFDAGQHYWGPRYVYNPLTGSALAYYLYQDAAHSIEWGDSGFGNTYGANSLAGTGTGAAQTYTIYGALIKDALASGGDYNDTLTVTAIW